MSSQSSGRKSISRNKKQRSGFQCRPQLESLEVRRLMCNGCDAHGIIFGDTTGLSQPKPMYLNFRTGEVSERVQGWSVDPVSNPDKFVYLNRQSTCGDSVDPLSDPDLFRDAGHQQPNRGSIDPVSEPSRFLHADHQQNQQTGLPEPAPGAKSVDGAIDQSANDAPIPLRMGDNLPEPDDYFEELGQESGRPGANDFEQPIELPPPTNLQRDEIPLPEAGAPDPFGAQPDTLLGPKGEVEYGSYRNTLRGIFETSDWADELNRALTTRLLRNSEGLASPFMTGR